MKRISAALLALCMVAGCGSPDPAPAASPAPPASAAPSTAPPSAATSPPDSFAEGTTPSQGPLVFVKVIDWVGAAEVSESGATFHLTENCAYLYGPPEEPVLLVWPDGQAWVDPAAPSTVHFREPGSGKLMRLTDGQRVNLGGYRIGGHGYTYRPAPHGTCPANGNDLAVQEVR